MKIRKLLYNSLTVFVLIGVALSSTKSASAQSEEALTISGWFNVIWGDAPDGSSAPMIYTITDDNGQKNLLLIDDSLAESNDGILSLNRQRVIIQGTQALSESADGALAVIQVESITSSDPASSGQPELNAFAVTGSQPFVSIMCKFSDNTAEPKTLSYFQGMYGSTYPGLDHYWREVSYNSINIVNSNAFGWYTLPQPRSYYIYITGL